VKVFSDLFAEEYNTQREQWENVLKAELKLGEATSKTTKKHLDLGNWPTLSLEAAQSQQMSSATAWKKAAQTYYNIDQQKIQHSLKDDLEGGARVFFFNKDFLNEGDWSLIEKTLKAFSPADEIEVYLFGKKILKTESGLKIFDENQMIVAREAHEQGGHNVHELALLTCKLIEGLETHPSHVGVFMDSHFFKNIAKVRAVKLLIQKVCKETGEKILPQIVTLNSYREWTLFERYSNMLRNNVQVASGYVAGAEVVQSSGYQIIFDLETNSKDAEHDERSQRMARNTSHILNLESMLGLVDDAAFGSYHLENLSHQYAEAAWKLMQVLLSFAPAERADFLNNEVQKIRALRLERVKTRKDVLAGVNDYPDGKEHLGATLKKAATFRVSRVFEEARLKVETVKNKPKVEILLHGDVGALNNRINFIKNYFELIGLEVIDPTHSYEKPENKILVLCAKDEDYPELAKQAEGQKCFAKFVAGKVELPGYEAIHAGQDVYQVLSQLANKLAGEK
jgi:hypothetical protein